MTRLTIALLLPLCLFGQQQPALEGLDPVLLSQGKEEPGKPDLTAKHGRFLYVFANTSTRDQFQKDPDRWGIQLGGSCARMGEAVQGSPDSYHVHEGRIYVFGSDECYRLFKQSPARYLASPVVWKPAPESVRRGSARLGEIRKAMGLNGISGWKEVRKTGETVRSMTATLPLSMEVESKNPRFGFKDTIAGGKVTRTFANGPREVEGSAAAVVRAGYLRDLAWLLSGSLEASLEAGANGGALEVYTGADVVRLDASDNRITAVEWRGRASDGSVAKIRVTYSDYRENDGAWFPRTANVSVDGTPTPAMSFVVESFAIVRARQTGWLQWGGPARDFQIAATVKPWADAGPKRLWSRALGDGYSGVVVNDGAVYTMYRAAGEEVVLAASAATGNTIWEYRYAAPVYPGFEDAQGPGPRATPLLDGDRLFTIGMSGVLHCLQRDSGKPLWSVDFKTAFGAKIRARGYSVSPMPWKENIIVFAGGPGASVVSLRKADGAVAWKSRDEEIAYASPFVMRVAGRSVLVALMAREVMGLDPDTGALLWSHPHANSELVNASTPVAGADGILFMSSAYDGGCRALQVSADGVKELWSHRLMRLHHGNAVRIGDTVFGSSGDSGPSPLTALDVKSGKVLWRDRSLGKANLLAMADAKLLLLDDDGNLLLVETDPRGPRVLAKSRILTGLSWTPPALADGTLYVRDRSELAAFALN